jgi:hypothetical protein
VTDGGAFLLIWEGIWVDPYKDLAAKGLQLQKIICSFGVVSTPIDLVDEGVSHGRHFLYRFST